jgi:hypothetical protein
MQMVLEWFLTGSIYGIALIAALAGAVAFVLSKLTQISINHFAVGVVVFVALLFTLPTYPRYKFDRDIQSNLLNAAHVHVINKTYWGAITEPVTWFMDFIGSVNLVYPEGVLSGNSFRHVVMRYEEEPRVYAVTPTCNEKRKDVAEPDAKGVFRWTGWNKKMTDEDFQLYCVKNWDIEKQAVRLLQLNVIRKTQE